MGPDGLRQWQSSVNLDHSYVTTCAEPPQSHVLTYHSSTASGLGAGFGSGQLINPKKRVQSGHADLIFMTSDGVSAGQVRNCTRASLGRHDDYHGQARSELPQYSSAQRCFGQSGHQGRWQDLDCGRYQDQPVHIYINGRERSMNRLARRRGSKQTIVYMGSAFRFTQT